jgi:hypothetical protein
MATLPAFLRVLRRRLDTTDAPVSRQLAVYRATTVSAA